jgi:hypothetical protein
MEPVRWYAREIRWRVGARRHGRAGEEPDRYVDLHHDQGPVRLGYKTEPSEGELECLDSGHVTRPV